MQYLKKDLNIKNMVVSIVIPHNRPEHRPYNIKIFLKNITETYVTKKKIFADAMVINSSQVKSNIK